MKHVSHTVRQMSLIAYNDINWDGTAFTQRQRILEFIKYAYPLGFTRNEISRCLKIPINAVCGRVDELRTKLGKIEETELVMDAFTQKPNMLLVYKK